MLTTTKITRIDKARGGRHYQVGGFPDPFPSVTTVLGVINKPAPGALGPERGPGIRPGDAARRARLN